MVRWELNKPHWITAVVYYGVLTILYLVLAWIIT